MNRKIISLALCCAPLISNAADNGTTAEEPSSITASAELGLLYKTGNTKSGDVKAGLDIKWEEDVWRSTLEWDMLVKKAEQADENGDETFATTDQKWTITSKTNYTLEKNGKNYIYGDIAYENNRFSGYEDQSSISMGWGRQWYKSKDTSFFADIGPGYKRDVTRATADKGSETLSSFIIQAQALYVTKLNEHVEFKQSLSAKYAPKSGENDKYKAETSITTKLIETLQLKFSFTIDHNSVVDEGNEKTETQTAMTLVYSF